MSKIEQTKIPISGGGETTPEKWVVLKIGEDVYKVFGSWAGGYLGSDSWKLNSGIKKVAQDENFYYFYGYSGSCYKCGKKQYGVACSFAQGVLDSIVEKSPTPVEILSENFDFENL